MERLRTLGGTAKLVFDVIQYPFSLVASFKNLILIMFAIASFFCFDETQLFLEIYFL